MALNGLPYSIEVRTPAVRTRHYIDYTRLHVPPTTAQGLASMYAHTVLELEARLIEKAVLEGHDRFEVQREGWPTTVHTVPLWRDAFQARLKVTWARWRHRHPDFGERLLAALSWSGTVWSAAVVPPRRPGR